MVSWCKAYVADPWHVEVKRRWIPRQQQTIRGIGIFTYICFLIDINVVYNRYKLVGKRIKNCQQ